MTFEQRNAAWTGEPRYFRQTQTRSSTPRFWKCWVDGAMIYSEWGQVGGAVQQVTERSEGVNKGKRNAISPEDYALYLGRERCRKKHWEGYREVGVNPDGTTVLLDEHVAQIDFNNPAPNLAFWKPDNSPGAGIVKKALANGVWYVRKMNGLMYCAWSNADGDVYLTSRRMLRQHDLETGSQYTWNDRFPHIVEALRAVMPPKSCLLGELTAFDPLTNQDKLHLIEGYTKSLTPRALEDQAKTGWAWYYIWDVAFWDAQDLVKEAPVKARYELIHSLYPQQQAPILPVQIVTPEPANIAGGWYGPPDHMRELAKKLKWEGFIAVDPDGVFDDRAYNFKGKPDRPGKYAAKVKPEYEDDFIVFWDPEKGHGEYSSKGRYGGKGMESATLWQYNTQGELIYISNVGSGLTEEMKTNAHPSQFPQVWKVVYTERRYKSKGDKTNALDHPRFDSVRTDKKPEECVNPEL